MGIMLVQIRRLETNYLIIPIRRSSVENTLLWYWRIRRVSFNVL